MPSGSLSIIPERCQHEAGLSAQNNDFSTDFGLLPPVQRRSTDEDDATMPHWGEPLGNKPFEYGTWDDESSAGEDLPTAQSLGIGSGSDSVASSKSSNYDLAAAWSTDIGYSSGSDADVESDTESHPELDNLLQMSPLSSRAATPIGEIEVNDMNELESEVSFKS